jgi:hypothetical protein
MINGALAVVVSRCLWSGSARSNRVQRPREKLLPRMRCAGPKWRGTRRRGAEKLEGAMPRFFVDSHSLMPKL